MKGVIILELAVCIGSSCHLKKSREIIQLIEQEIKANKLEDKLVLVGSFCMNECSNHGVCIRFNDKKYSLNTEQIKSFFAKEVLGVFHN